MSRKLFGPPKFKAKMLVVMLFAFSSSLMSKGPVDLEIETYSLDRPRTPLIPFYSGVNHELAILTYPVW